MNDIDRLEDDLDEVKRTVSDLQDVARGLYLAANLVKPIACLLSHEPHWRTTRTCWLCEVEILSENESRFRKAEQRKCSRCGKQLEAGPTRVCVDCKMAGLPVERDK